MNTTMCQCPEWGGLLFCIESTVRPFVVEYCVNAL